MKLAATISLVFSVCAFQCVNAAVTLVQPAPTSIPPVPSFSFSLPTGVSIPSLSIPTPNPSASLSSLSVTAVASVSVGGIESADGATTYFLQNIVGVNGETTTFTRTIVQGATVWRDDELHETCSLDGKGIAVCNLGVPSVFETSFTGTAIPIFTVGANAAGGGGSGGGSGGSGSSNGSAGGSTGGAPRVNGGASVGWMLVASVAAMVAGRRLVL
ncbi:hypothetical protein B0H17DRAFT_1124829 [Mycena rosella]|uniref:GPI anchored protein n=1 Tax=Mycena rosella TaxID=1033263 RepID=A0AAD7GYR2_MYCRO|nr:hypothetical protein B0H17DRAFT_1124829 [Mycena rosella]